jgi:hypothetical protein
LAGLEVVVGHQEGGARVVKFSGGRVEIGGKVENAGGLDVEEV